MSRNKKPLTKRQKNKRKLIVFIVEIVILLVLLGVFWFAVKHGLRHKKKKKKMLGKQIDN